MKILFLQGFGISIKVVDGKVRITNGKSLFNNHKKEREMIEVSGTPNFDKIVIEGTSGWVSMESLKMLSDYGVNVIMVDKKGRLFANYNQIGGSSEPLLRQKQYECFNHNDKVEHLRKWVVSQKIESQIQLFKELITKLKLVNNNRARIIGNATLNMQKHYDKLSNAHSLTEITAVESYVGAWYYPNIARILRPELGFHARTKSTRNQAKNDASDVINALLNYGFSVLHSEVAKQLNAIGLDCYVGFYHRNKPSTVALVYDMMEPFRYLVDKAVLQIANTITEKDYHYRKFENKYPYSRFNHLQNTRWLFVSKELKKRYVSILSSIFENKRSYKAVSGRTSKDGNVQMKELTIMETKCVELRDYILGTRKSLIEPLKVIAR